MEGDDRLQCLPLHNLQGPQLRSPHSRFPSQSSFRERCSVSRALLELSEFLVSGPPPPMVLNWAPMERDAGLQRPLQHISPWVNVPPSRLPSRAPSERDACPLSPLPCILPDPQQRSSPSRFP
jgi:hypothetical protein